MPGDDFIRWLNARPSVTRRPPAQTARLVLFAYCRTYELLNGDYGPTTTDTQTEMSGALDYLAGAYKQLTGEPIGPAFDEHSAP